MPSKGHATINYSEICSRVPENLVLGYYFPSTGGRVPSSIRSPLREDRKPSFSFYVGGNGRIMYKDFANGDGGSLQWLLSRIWACQPSEVAPRIYSDTGGKFDGHNDGTDTLGGTLKGKRHVIIRSRMRKWEQYDIDYWESYGVPPEWLGFGRIYPIDYVIQEYPDGRVTQWRADKLAYTFVETKDGVMTQKIYQPKSPWRKWISGAGAGIWDLWHQVMSARNKKRLIITSSRKDALCIWANTGIPACNMQGEGYMPSQEAIDALKSNFREIYVLYDNDYMRLSNPGRENGIKVAKAFGVPRIEIPEVYKSKDSSDLYMNHGKTVMRRIVLTLVEKASMFYSNNQKSEYEGKTEQQRQADRLGGKIA